MAFREYGKYDAVGLADLVRKKEVSAGDYDFAKKQVDKGLPDGPFSGVPFLLKDLDLLQGTVTTFGASVYHNNVGDHSGTLARRFLDTGVAIFGKAQAPNSG